MRTFKKSRSTIAVIIATFLLIQGVGWAKWKDRSDELPGMKSGGDIAKTTAIVGGVAAGALITYFLIKKSRNMDDSRSAAAERSWEVQDPRAVDPALVREAQEAMLNRLVPVRPSLDSDAVAGARSPMPGDASDAAQASELATAR